MSRLVAVTGAAGFLGRHCVAALSAAGFGVRRLTRTPRGPEDAAFRLGEPVSADALRGVDALIHAAHDFEVYGWDEQVRVNIEGSKALFRAAGEAGVKTIVAVSSISAFEGCPGQYGRAKLEIEAAARAAGGIIVRPGLIHAPDAVGIFATLRRLSALPALPVPDGGGQILYLAHADDTAAAIVAALDWDTKSVPAPVTLAHPAPVTFKDLLRTLAREKGKSPLFIPFPSAPLLGAMGLAEALGSRLRPRRDSLVGLLHANPAPNFEPARRLGLKFRAFA